MIKTIYFYKQTFEDGTDEIRTLCKACAKQIETDGYKMEQIDKAGEWDECWCGAQNVPSWYNPNPPFIAGTMN